MNSMAFFYQYGISTGKDINKAFDNYYKAACLNNTEAQYNLANLIGSGDHICPPNIKADSGPIWKFCSIINGYPRAQFEMAEIKRYSQLSQRSISTLSMMLYMTSAGSGYEHAISRLNEIRMSPDYDVLISDIPPLYAQEPTVNIAGLYDLAATLVRRGEFFDAFRIFLLFVNLGLDDINKAITWIWNHCDGTQIGIDDFNPIIDCAEHYAHIEPNRAYVEQLLTIIKALGYHDMSGLTDSLGVSTFVSEPTKTEDNGSRSKETVSATTPPPKTRKKTQRKLPNERPSVETEKETKITREKLPNEKPSTENMRASDIIILADRYYDGDDADQSYEIAFILYEEAAQKGDPDAMIQLAHMLYHGEGVEQSYELAFEWYKRASDCGHPESFYHLGRMYEDGEGVEQSYELAYEYYLKAVNRGYDKANNSLRSIEEYMEEKSASQHDRSDENENVLVIFDSSDSDDDDTESASDESYIKELTDRALKGDLESIITIGDKYYWGERVEQSYREAMDWYKIAASRGNTYALYMLGQMYQFGNGVSASYEDARYWYTIAAKKGDANSKQALKNLPSDTKDSQIAKRKSDSRKQKPTNTVTDPNRTKPKEEATPRPKHSHSPIFVEANEFTTFSSMTEEQESYYDYWLEQLENGNHIRTDVGYIAIRCEYLVQSTDDPAKVSEQLFDLYDYYHSRITNSKRILTTSYVDYNIYKDLKFVDDTWFYSDNYMAIRKNMIPTLIGNLTKQDVFLLFNKSTYSSISDYSLHLFNSILSAIDDHLRTKGCGLFDLCDRIETTLHLFNGMNVSVKSDKIITIPDFATPSFHDITYSVIETCIAPYNNMVERLNATSRNLDPEVYSIIKGAIDKDDSRLFIQKDAEDNLIAYTRRKNVSSNPRSYNLNKNAVDEARKGNRRVVDLYKDTIEDEKEDEPNSSDDASHQISFGTFAGDDSDENWDDFIESLDKKQYDYLKACLDCDDSRAMRIIASSGLNRKVLENQINSLSNDFIDDDVVDDGRIIEDYTDALRARMST